MKLYALTIGAVLAGCGDLGMEPIEVKPITLTITSDGKPVELQITTQRITPATLNIVEKPAADR